MKKIILFFAFLILNAQPLEFVNPFSETNSTKQSTTNVSIDINTEQNTTVQQNSTDQNSTQVQTVTFEDNFVTLSPKIKLAVLINKKRFYKFLPSILNSINAYFLSKGVNYDIKVYNKDTNLSDLTQQYKNIIVYSLDKNYIQNLSEYNSTNFYIPVYNKNDIETNATNIYFGGIDYKQQINSLISYMDTDSGVAINDNTIISKKLFNIESDYNLNLIPYTFPNIYYKNLNQSYIFLNTDAGKSAQVLSNITAKNIDTKLVFATQIDYNPLLIEITQPQNVQKLLIANSIIYFPKKLEDINLNLKTDIQFNWLNYSTNVLLNKIYNNLTQNDQFYMNDFKLYIFGNQINYNTKLYQIINGGFKLIQ